jgi:DHA1 family multidrug resistance protein-like MFS transporter
VGAAGVTAFLTALPFLGEKKVVASANSEKSAVKSVIRGWVDVARNRGVLIVGLIEASQYYAYGSVEFFLVKYLGEIGDLDPFLQGVVMGSQLVVVMLSKPYMGRLSDRFGRRIPIVAGSIVSGVPLILIPFFTQFPILLLLSVTYGLGFSLVTSSTPALVSELVSIQVVGGAMGLLGMIMDVGQTLGPLVSSLILVTSLRYAGLFSSLTIVLLFSCTLFLLSKTAEARLTKSA